MGVICTEACRTFQGPSRAHRTPQDVSDAFPAVGPYLRLIRFQGANRLLKRKENSSRGSRRRHQARLRYRPLATSPFGNFNPFPFRAMDVLIKTFHTEFPSSLRTDLPMSNCCSHGTFLHFSLQSSHLNICYYHQDLH